MRKKLDATPVDQEAPPPAEAPQTPAEATPDNATSINLNIVEPDDAQAPEKPKRLKKAFQSVFLTDEDDEKASKRKPRKSHFFVKYVDIAVGASLFCIHLLVPDEYKEVFYVNSQAYTILPTEKHLSDILTPIARIADRHSNIANVNPDVVDIIAAIQASAVCGMEVRANMIMKKHIELETAKQERDNTTNYLNTWRIRNYEQQSQTSAENN